MCDKPERTMTDLERIERWARARQREQRNAEIVEYVKKHGDHRSTLAELATVCGLSVMAVRDIWRTAFSHWNYARRLKGLPLILNDGFSTKRARYVVVPATVHPGPSQKLPVAYDKAPRYTIEEAFKEITRLDKTHRLINEP